VIVDMQTEQIHDLLRMLGEAFFADHQMFEAALDQGMSFYLIHKETMFKVDVFPIKDRAFDGC